MSAPYYPAAKQHPLHDHAGPDRDLADINLIVLHITDGSTAASAIATFEQSKAPRRVSAHFVIDRDGTVYQLLPIAATAWHASQANAHSIGIEHAATKKLPVSKEQMRASAELVAWLTQVLRLPIDRAHIRTHNEASPRDGHVGCCTDGLNPDHVVEGALIATYSKLYNF